MASSMALTTQSGAEAFDVPDPALDISGDGQVGPEEYDAWRGDFGGAGPDLPADFNGDGVVNSIDYAVLRDDGPDSVTSGSGADGTAMALLTSMT